MQIFLNHQSNPVRPSVFNRAFQFGDAHFTTLKIVDKQIHLFDFHLHRLKLANDVLGFSGFDQTALVTELQSIAAENNTCIVKVLISRGDSQRGYQVPDDIACQVYLFVSDFHPDAFSFPNGIELALLEFRLGYQPSLAGLKHCNRLEQILVKQEIANLGAKDGIVCGLEGELIETSVANIFVKIDDDWCTPDLSLAGIAGVKRDWLLAKMQACGVRCSVRKISAAEIKQVQAAVICNALMDLVVVSKIGMQKLSLVESQNLIRLVNA